MKGRRHAVSVEQVSTVGRTLAFFRRHPTVADGLVAAVFAVAALVSVSALSDARQQLEPGFRTPGQAATVASMLALTLPLAWRRRFPLTTVGAVVASFLVARMVLDVNEASMTVLAGSLAIYSGAVHGRPPLANVVLALGYALLIGELLWELFYDVPPQLEVDLLLVVFTILYNAVILALPWALGVVIRSLRERQRLLAERAADLQREREENARRAVFAERVRIARELHDVVAHHVSVMGVQAGAARRVMADQPEKAAAALSSIEASSRQAVLEMHRMLDFLRQEGDEADMLAPQPGLGQLPELVDQVGEAKLPVQVSVKGDPRPLPRSLDVSAYRVVQEALTNTLKHARAQAAAVRLHYQPHSLDIEVVDDGCGPAAHVAPKVGGHGLIGMRERVSLHGGHLRAGPLPEGGFSVHATFPLDGDGS